MQIPHKPLNFVLSGSKPPLCGKHFVKQLLKKVAKILLSVFQVKKLDGTLCGQSKCKSSSTSNLWSQLNASHKDWVVQQKANEVPIPHTLKAAGDGFFEVQHTTIKWAKHKWHKGCRRLALCSICNRSVLIPRCFTILCSCHFRTHTH